jgi:hypothetical protein
MEVAAWSPPSCSLLLFCAASWGRKERGKREKEEEKEREKEGIKGKNSRHEFFGRKIKDNLWDWSKFYFL